MLEITQESGWISISGNHKDFNDLADEVKKFLNSGKTEFRFPISQNDFPFISFAKNDSKVNIQISKESGLIVSGSTNYFSTLYWWFCFDATDEDDVSHYFDPVKLSHDTFGIKSAMKTKFLLK